MSEHPKDLDLYVMDALEPERRAEVEAHVMACDACGAELQRQARLELALPEIARAPAPVASMAQRRRRRWPQVAVAAGLSLAAAAGVALMLRRPPPAVAAGPIHISCPLDDGARACVDEATRHGLMVEFPMRRDVPRYEAPFAPMGALAAY